MKAFSKDDISVLLSYYADDGSVTVSSLEPSVFHGIPFEAGVNINDILTDTEYMGKVSGLVRERNRIGRDSPSLRIAPGRIPRSSLKSLLTKSKNLGLIFAAESVTFQDTVQAVHVESQTNDEHSSMNILGVHLRWLDKNTGRATRALLVDETGMVKDVSFKEPVELHVIQVLHLPRRGEMELHKEILKVFDGRDVEILNPYASSARADDKNLTHELWCSHASGGEFFFPGHRLVPSSLDRARVLRKVREFIGEAKDNGGFATGGVVVLPNKGTEGDKVKFFGSQMCDEITDYVKDSIHPEDDVLLREERGNVRFFRNDGRGYRNITFRINVSWNGKQFIAKSGFSQVAMNETSFVASRSRGGEIVSLDESFMSLYQLSQGEWVRVFPCPDDISRMKRAAVSALEALNYGLPPREYLKFAGIDMLLEARDFLLPVLLEVNPRPSGLSSSLPI